MFVKVTAKNVRGVFLWDTVYYCCKQFESTYFAKRAVIYVFGAVDKTSSSFSAHGKIGNFIIIMHDLACVRICIRLGLQFGYG